MSGLIEMITGWVTERTREKLRKKAKKKLRKLIGKALCTALVCFGVSMIWKHRKPIVAAIIGKKLLGGKCPVFGKK